ncbi:MAG: hypothetical protein A2Z25_03115 [Planctomycetes bacterium RBG_16_55_9]|nr:MAG: hypothetical protein A2Z25_03115 [Planctomycetes bacterium RBG_16_55_9]
MRKRTAKILKIVAVAIIVLGLIYAIAVGVSAAKLHRAYAALEKDGRPMKAQTVIPPKVPDAENAALLYESAGLLLKAQPAPNGNLLDYAGGLSKTFMKESLSQEKLAELQQLIEQDVVTKALWVIEQGARRRSCRFDRDYNAGVNILIPDLSILRGLSCILGAKACLEAQAGRLDEAWNMARTQLRLADATLNEPILIGQVVRIALIRFSLRTMREICEIAPPNEQQYRSLREDLAGLDDVGPLVRSIDGERLLFGEWAFNLPKDELHKINAVNERPDHMPGLIRWFVTFRLRFKPWFLADHAAYMRFMQKSMEFIERPYSEDRANNMEEDLNETHHLMTRMFIPAIPRVKVIYCEMAAELRITRAGLALLQYKQAHSDPSQCPDTLEGLQLGDINDPFSQEPLSYKPQGGGFILYSVGPDQKDNGGSPKQEKQEEDWDIVWQFPKEGHG